MFGILVCVIWIVFIVNLFALIGSIGIVRFLFSSGLIWLRALVDPNETNKSIKRQAGDAARYAMWTVGSAVVLMLLYL